MKPKVIFLFCLILISKSAFSQIIPFNINLNYSKNYLCPEDSSIVSATLTPGPAGFVIGAPHTFEWYKGIYDFNTGIWTYTLLSEVSNDSIVLKDVADYKLIVKSNSNSIPPVETTFNILAAFYPEIHTQFQLTSICLNQTLKIEAFPKSDPSINRNYTYQWKLDDIDIPGATNHQYFASVAGNYKVRIDNGSCAFTSTIKTLTSSNATLNETPIIRATNNSKICYGTVTHLINSVNQNPDYTFRWARVFNNNGNVTESLGEILTENYFVPADSGSYRGYVFNQGGCFVFSSNVVKITKPTIPLASIQRFGGFCDSLTVISPIPNPQNYNFQWAAIGDVQTSPTITNFTYRKDTVLFDNQGKNLLGLRNFEILPSPTTSVYLTNWALEHFISGSDGCAIRGVPVYFDKQVTGNAFSTIATSPNPGTLTNITETTSVYCAGTAVVLAANIKFTVGQFTTPPVGAVAQYFWTGPNNFTSNVRQPYFASIAENQAGEYTLKVDYYAAGNPTLCTSRTFKTSILIKPLVFYNINENPLEDAKVYCLGSNFNVALSPYHDNYLRPYADYGTFTGVWKNESGTTVATVTNANLAILSITNFSPQEYTFTGSLSGGMCPTPNILYKKKFVAATFDNIILKQKITPNACTNASFILTSNLGIGNITPGTPMKKYSFVGPGANWVNQDFFNNVSINYTNLNLGSYQHSIHACGITKSLTTSLVYPSNCPPLTNPIVENQTPAPTNTQSSIVSVTLPTIINVVPDSPINLLPTISPFYAENTFNWQGPNGFSSTSKRLFIPNANNTNEGEYTLISNFGSGFTPSSIITKVIVVVDSKPSNLEIKPKILAINQINKCVSQRLDFQDFITFEPADAFGHASFTWTGPSGFTSTNPFPVIPNLAANQAGIFKVLVTFSGKYVGVDSAMINVSLNPTATILGSDLICTNSSLLLEGNLQDLDQTQGQTIAYLWNGPNGFTSNIKQATINEAGTYTLNITKTGGGCNGAFSTQKTILLNPMAYTVNDLEVENFYLSSPLIKGKETGNYLIGKSFGLSATYQGIVNSYSWTGPNGFNQTTRQANILSPTNQNQGVYMLTANVKANACSGGTIDVNISKTITINILGCPSNLVVSNIAGNIFSGEKILKAEFSIEAANQIISGKTTYQANNYILLNAGFKVDSGTVFKTQYGGCN